ncbi:hypothetical protein [Streptomyces antibioticus]|uniref:hypothetical protein n=1 Tax=Streptomyces antibioticus TaxID=1890 RepID=UPI00340479FC
MTVVVLTAWLISSEFVKRDDVRVVTAVLCGKEMDGEDWLIRTSEGDFRLGDVPKRNAAQQYEALLAGGVYDITYQGMELPFLPRPVTRGVVLAPESASGRGVAPCSPER